MPLINNSHTLILLSNGEKTLIISLTGAKARCATAMFLNWRLATRGAVLIGSWLGGQFPFVFFN